MELESIGTHVCCSHTVSVGAQVAGRRAAATKGRTVISCLAHRALDACWLLGARDRRETPRLWRWAKGYAPVPASRVVDGSRKTWPASTKLIEPYGKHTEDSLGNGLNELERRKCRLSQSLSSFFAPPPLHRGGKKTKLWKMCVRLF